MSRDVIMDRRLYVDGQRIFNQGDPGDAAYIVQEGRVGIYLRPGDTDEEVELGTIELGGLFGEMAVIDGGQRMASAVALGKTVLLRVPKDVFEAKMGKADPFVRAVLNIFIGHIRNTHQAFIRRPRSLADYIRLVMGFTDNMQTYVNMIEVSPYSNELAAKLADLDRAAREIEALVAREQDRRESVVRPGDEKGVPPRVVFGRDHG
jgi:CRP/FNR family cyclic AMP-dependent transcriptional regulator